MSAANGSHAVAVRSPGDIVEAVIAKGDLSKLTPGERTQYYVQVCESVGLNPLTKPFEYITLNGKLVLYARKDCTDLLGKGLVLPAHERLMDASHAFNLLDARGVLAVNQRAAHIADVRNLARACADRWLELRAAAAGGKA